jgi:hypothetical protein
MISQKFNGFNTWFPIVIAYLILNATRLRISSAQITALTAMGTAWTPAWAKYSSMATQTHGSISDIQGLYDDDHSYMEKVKLQLKYDMNVELSGDDIRVIEIHVDADPRGEVPAYGYAPNGVVVNNRHLLASIDVSSTEEGHTNDGKKPVDVARIGMKRIIIGATAPIPAASTFLPYPASGSVDFDMAFTADQAGMQCCVVFWYENPKGDNRSPESVMLVFPII